MKAKAKELDRKFDAGEDITMYLDLTRARRPGHEQRRVNVDFPVWMIESLDREASRLGVPRQSLIKMLIARHLEELGLFRPELVGPGRRSPARGIRRNSKPLPRP
jgi:hypothetical protein